jgi:ATP-dependent Clp protease ATP-binding subunit ClpB
MVDRDPDEVRKTVMSELDRTFRPEFLNRIDDIILFHSLKPEHMVHIVDIQLERLENLLKERRMTIELSHEAKEHLAQAGYDPAFGARPLKRIIQREVYDALALALLEGQVHEGDHILVDYDSQTSTLTFESVVVQGVAL